MRRGHESDWRPQIIDPASRRGQAILAELVDDPQTIALDTLAGQIDDLLQSRHPAMSAAQRQKLGIELEAQLARWVYYPWSRTLVRTLPALELREARLARNRNKISVSEEARLADSTIAIVGLSVGRQIARTLVMEGVPGRLRLADGDTLSLSNLNRLPAGIRDLGLSKAVLAARELLEIDPYLDVEVFPGGILPEALDEFLFCGDRAPDLVIEECDDFEVKIRLRERLRGLRIPVIMESSVRGTLDIERFDIEPDRPLLHGLLEGVDPSTPRDIHDIKELVTRILPHMGSRTRQSIEQVGHTLRSWPQLASEIALGAATATFAARKILLGMPMASGRYVIDLDECLDRPLVAPCQPASMILTEAGWVD